MAMARTVTRTVMAQTSTLTDDGEHSQYSNIMRNTMRNASPSMDTPSMMDIDSDSD